MKRRDILRGILLGLISAGIPSKIMASDRLFSPGTLSNGLDNHVKDYLHKMSHFNEPHKDDIYVGTELYPTFKSTVRRLRRLERIAGHGNYQILSFDEGLRIARKYSQVGDFKDSETELMERIFYEEAKRYGFFGQKPLKKMTDRINKKDVIKVPYTGNFLYKGVPLKTYHEIKQHVGDQVILTSGIRGVLKQFLLFMNKAYNTKGNLSLASRSLAPPGYSFHSKGDFDVGQVGFGSLNFTKRFTNTDVFKRLSDLGYLKLRYPQQNLLGVRFEPWHIKIKA